jgi:PilZ domain-containing protein
MLRLGETMSPEGTTMAATLQEVATAVVRRAQRQGYVVPRDIRSELTLAGLPEEQWKEVASLARESLNYRQGRYYHISSLSPRLQQEQNQQQIIQRAIRRLIKEYRASATKPDRRGEERIDFIQTVTVELEDGRQFTLLSRDLSTTGIRLIGTKRLLGHKVRLFLPQGDNANAVFLVRVLWTCAVGEDLYENGGTFLEVLSQ